jgi:hypothetical protein
MVVDLKLQAWQVWSQIYDGPIGWVRIEFERWWRVDHNEPCAIKAAGRRGSGKCHAPCRYCLSKLEAIR